MAEEDKHSATVDAWLQHAGEDASVERLLQIFEEGFEAVWRRAHRTLGEVTLTAIADRVLCTASERFPDLSVLRIEHTGLYYGDLRAQVATLDRAQLLPAIRFVLVEFLSVLGALTAEILSPALHAELAKLGSDKFVRSAPNGADQAQPPTELRGEDSKL